MVYRSPAALTDVPPVVAVGSQDSKVSVSAVRACMRAWGNQRFIYVSFDTFCFVLLWGGMSLLLFLALQPARWPLLSSARAANVSPARQRYQLEGEGATLRATARALSRSHPRATTHANDRSMRNASSRGRVAPSRCSGSGLSRSWSDISTASVLVSPKSGTSSWPRRDCKVLTVIGRIRPARHSPGCTTRTHGARLRRRVSSCGRGGATREESVQGGSLTL